MDGLASRLRFCAHLLGDPFDTCLLKDSGVDFLRWLVEVGFRKVLVHLNSAVLRYTESDISETAQALSELIKQDSFTHLSFVFSVPDNINDKARMLLEKLLEKVSSKKVALLYNSLRGGGEKGSVYASPLAKSQQWLTGYAGGFRPGNVLQKLQDMEWVIPEGSHVFIEAQSGVRQSVGATDEFSFQKCEEFADKIATSKFNPAAGAEVYHQYNGTLVLGDSAKIILYPSQNYEVTATTQSKFSVKLETGQDSIFIAGSIATRYFSHHGEGVLPPKPVPEATRARMSLDAGWYVFLAVSADVLRDHLQPPRRSTLKILSSPANEGAPYYGKTPLEYLQMLLQSEEWETARTMRARDAEYAVGLLQKWSQGLVVSMDEGEGGKGHVSVASAGFGSRAKQHDVFRGTERDSLAHRGVAIVSISGASPELCNTVIRICMEDGMHFAVGWHTDWGDAWFYAWLRSVSDAMLHGCVPVVLTWNDGEIGYAQSAEVLALESLA